MKAVAQRHEDAAVLGVLLGSAAYEHPEGLRAGVAATLAAVSETTMPGS